MIKKLLFLLAIILFFSNSIIEGDSFLNLDISQDMTKMSSFSPSSVPTVEKLYNVIIANVNGEKIKSYLKKNGIKIESCGETYCHVLINISQYNELISKGLENKVFLSKKMKPLVNAGVPLTGGYALHYGDNISEPLKGKGVIIGVVDTGIDIYHPDFSNADNSTRIAFLWDQTIKGDSKSYPKNFNYGYECDSYSINNKTCPSNDKGSITDPSIGHGTHVAGIVGSNDKTYTGMAPEGTFIIVKSLFDEASVIDGVRYIFQKATALGMPAVINMSFGNDAGPHDGTSYVEDTLGKMVGKGKILVAAAGNSGDVYKHFSGEATSETGYVKFSPAASLTLTGTVEEMYLDIWYSNEMKFKILLLDKYDNKVIAESGFHKSSECSCSSSDCSTLVCTDILKTAGGNSIATVGVASGIFANNHKWETVILISKESESLSDYRWALGFEKDLTNERFNAWLVNDSGSFEMPSGGGSSILRNYFDTDGNSKKFKFFFGDTNCTVTVPSTNKDIFAVGSYIERNSWIDKDGQVYGLPSSVAVVGDISEFSSKGGSCSSIVKPDITAPGQFIISSMSSNVNPPGCGSDPDCMIVDDHHFIEYGTSMASPFVAGGIALLLEWNNNITFDDLFKMISLHADTDDYTGNVPNYTWGYGKFQLKGIVNNLNQEKMKRDPLEISNVKITKNTSDGKVTFYWETNRLGDSSVYYWKSGGSKSLRNIESYGTRHSITVTGLGTTSYTFQMVSVSPYDETVASKKYTVSMEEPSSGCSCDMVNSSFSNGVYIADSSRNFDPVVFIFLMGFIFIKFVYAKKRY